MNDFFGIISITKLLVVKFMMMHLQLVSKSTIFVTIDVIILHGTIVKTTCNCIFNYKMVLSPICNYG
jgi:hypothetical protein